MAAKNAKNEDFKEYDKKFNFFMLLIYVLALVLLFFMFRPFLTYLILGVILVILFHPLNKFIRKHVKNKTFAASIMTLLLIVIILVPTFFLASMLISESSNLISSVSSVDLDSLSDQLGEIVGYRVNLKGLALKVVGNLSDLVTDAIPSIVTIAFDAGLNVFIMFFLMFYGFKEGDVLLKQFMDLIPIKKSRKAELINETTRNLRGVLYGQLLVSVIQGFLGGLGFWIFGVPNPVLWGFIMGIFSFIPFLGTPLVWVPAVIFEFAKGDIGLAIGLLLYSGIIVTNIDNFVKPKLIGHETGMHPVLVLLGIFGGIALFGVIGMIIGPVVVALCVLVIKYFNTDLQVK